MLIRNRLPLNGCLNASVIPWWDGTIKISKAQRKLGAAAIRDLLSLFSDLRVIVLVGNIAKRAWTASGLAAPAGVQIFPVGSPELAGARSLSRPMGGNFRHLAQAGLG